MKDEVVVAFILGYFIGKISQKYGGVEPTAKKVIVFVIDAYDILFGNVYDTKILKRKKNLKEVSKEKMFKRVLEEISKLETIS